MAITFENRPKPSGLFDVSHIGLQEITVHPFGSGNLTIDGQQFSTPSTTGTASNVLATVGPSTAQPPVVGDMYELEFGLTSAIRQDATAPSTIQWMWQGRNIGQSSWRNLMAANDSTVTESTAYVENTYSGRLNLTHQLDVLPFEVQLVITKADSRTAAARSGVAKIKSSTYAKAITSRMYQRTTD